MRTDDTHSFDEYLVGQEDLSISDAMTKIDNNALGILFVLHEDGKLAGCITDGDIRRYLLENGSLSDNVTKAMNVNPLCAYTKEEAKLKYHKRNFKAVPIIDNNRRIISIYLGDDSIESKTPLHVPVVINAGGKGTRLDPFTRVLPKPLIPVGDTPILEYIMNEFKSYRCDDFHIIVNYKKDLLKSFFSDSVCDYRISWYEEEEPLGTGGGLCLLKNAICETFFFSNCDVLLTADYNEMMKFHKENHNIITMVCAKKKIDIPYGVVETSRDGVIETMKEKPQISFLVNTGIYIVEPSVIDDMELGVPISFPEIIRKEKENGKKVSAFVVDETDWMDMGQLPELEKMRVKLLEGSHS